MRQYRSFFCKVLNELSEKHLLLYRHKPRSLENFWFCNNFSHNIYYFFTPVKIFSLLSIRAVNSTILQHFADSTIVVHKFFFNFLLTNKFFRLRIMQRYFICQIFSLGKNC